MTNETHRLLLLEKSVTSFAKEEATSNRNT